MSVSGPTTMKFIVVSPPVENIFSVITKRFHRSEVLPAEVFAFLACLHRVANSNELRFLYSSMACFAIGAQVITHFSQDRVQQRLHPRRERYTMSATSLCTLVSPSLPCPSCRSVDRLQAPVSRQQLESDFWLNSSRHELAFRSNSVV